MSKCINDAGDQRTVDKQGVGDFGFLLLTIFRSINQVFLWDDLKILCQRSFSFGVCGSLRWAVVFGIWDLASDINEVFSVLIFFLVYSSLLLRCYFSFGSSNAVDIKSALLD